MMLVLQFTRMSMRMSAEEVMVRMTFAADLAVEIESAEAEQRRARDAREPHPDAFVQCDAKPRNQQPEQRGKENVSTTSERGDTGRARVSPMLRPRRKHEGQP